MAGRKSAGAREQILDAADALNLRVSFYGMIVSCLTFSGIIELLSGPGDPGRERPGRKP